MNAKKARKAPVVRHSHDLLNQRRSLIEELGQCQLEYERHLAEKQPLIDSLNCMADDLASQFRSLYLASQVAYTDGERAMAKELSEKGHAAEDECRRVNGHANVLRRQLRSQLDHLEALRKRIKQLEDQAAASIRTGAGVRRTHVTGFSAVAVMSDAEIEEFLDTLPQVIFHKVASIEFAETVYGYGRYADIEAKARGDWTKDGKLRIRIGRRCATKDELKRAIAHELGHVVYQHFLSDELRAEWYGYYAETKPADFVSLEALPDEEEDFAECFSMFVVHPARLRAKNKAKYGFMKELVKNLSRR